MHLRACPIGDAPTFALEIPEESCENIAGQITLFAPRQPRISHIPDSHTLCF